MLVLPQNVVPRLGHKFRGGIPCVDSTELNSWFIGFDNRHFRIPVESVFARAVALVVGVVSLCLSEIASN